MGKIKSALQKKTDPRQSSDKLRCQLPDLPNNWMSNSGTSILSSYEGLRGKKVEGNVWQEPKRLKISRDPTEESLKKIVLLIFTSARGRAAIERVGYRAMRYPCQV